MPFGSAFDALTQFCIQRLTSLETESVKEVSYYVETTAFVNYLRKSEKYTKVEITGHSLGGSLAFITGAQTKTKAVGLSAPGAYMGRLAVTPQISVEDIKRYTYALLPNRDIVNNLGGKHINCSEINCRADLKDSFTCHNAYRSMCELLYTCGGKVRRPVSCLCMKFGYPEPTASDGSETSFVETCRNSE